MYSIVNSTVSPSVTKRNTNSACDGGSKRKTIIDNDCIAHGKDVML